MGEASKLARDFLIDDPSQIDAALSPIRAALEIAATMYELGEQIERAQYGDHRELKRLERLRGKNRRIIKEAIALLSPATAEQEKR